MSKYLLLILAMLGGGLIILFNGKNNSKEENKEVIVGASSFLEKPLKEMKEAYERINKGAKVKLIFNQSSKLEEEIVRGVKMDIFIAYKEKYTDYIVDVGIAEESDVKSFGDTQVFYKKDLTESQNLESDIEDEEKFKYTVIRLSNNILANKFMAFVESKEGEAILKKYSLIRKK
ncbi:substrate-binding domain-containing protein [Clostridium massiliamazoniense]|uniref:substrate-binding domain-containing protein n=1 Tax=Clostridium massiliamazoniense TaxID=1347366 RepID=UPI0006D80681|nr:substrate-binding domain-containing protein [Clostridium massiliamazoniense]